MACSSCGAIPKRTPRLDTIHIPHPDGAITVLGRKVDLVAEMEVWECPTCLAVQCECIRFPLDPDALLIGDVFDMSNCDVALEDVVAYLKDNNISAADLEELATLKRNPTNVDGLLKWWTMRGLSPLVVVPEGQGSSPVFAKMRNEGIAIEETADMPSKAKGRGPIRFLRPASNPGSRNK